MKKGERKNSKSKDKGTREAEEAHQIEQQKRKYVKKKSGEGAEGNGERGQGSSSQAGNLPQTSTPVPSTSFIKSDTSESAVLPIECRTMMRRLKSNMYLFIKRIIGEISGEIGPRDKHVLENLARVERRALTFVKEVFIKLDEAVSFEKILDKKIEYRIEEKDMALFQQAETRVNELRETVEMIEEHKRSLQQSLASELEQQIENMILSPKDEFTNIKIRKGSTAHSVEHYLENYISVQRNYLAIISQCVSTMEDNFEKMKIQLINRFKAITKENMRLEEANRIFPGTLSDAEKILLG